jgi:membrane protein implicated in regulation of membrane protease activity
MDLGSPETWRWVWLAAAVTFTLGELAVAGSFFLAPFAIAAAAAFVVSYAGAAVEVGWLVFVLGSVAMSLALRPLARRLDASSPPSNEGVNRWHGREGVVLADIPAGVAETGLVRLEREEWRAQSADGSAIPAGTRVVVSRVDGTRLVVASKE